MQIVGWKSTFTSALALMLAFGLLTSAQAQAPGPGPLRQHMLEMYADPDEYYLFEDDRKKVIDYKTERMVRICAGDSRHVVPLRVTYDDKRITLGSGDCIRVEAKEVYLEPDAPLEAGWVLHAEVDTLY